MQRSTFLEKICLIFFSDSALSTTVKKRDPLLTHYDFRVVTLPLFSELEKWLIIVFIVSFSIVAYVSSV